MPKQNPKPGDLIEIFRGPFQHWAVYIGDDYVVHLVPPSGISSGSECGSVMAALPGYAIVKKEKMDDVVGKDQWRISNFLDNKYRARSPDVIVREAKRQVGQTLFYSPGDHNCEHFATSLRYGIPESRQGRWFKTAAYAVTGVVGVGVALVVGAPLGVAAIGAAVGGLAKLVFG